jgi:hypothetical protein
VICSVTDGGLHKVHIYLEYHTQCLSPRWNWDPANDSRGTGTKTTGDVNTAEPTQHAGDANSAAIVIPGDANTAGRGEANTADGNKTAQSNIIPLRLQKVPAMFKEPLPPQPKPAAEPPATPSATYKAIMGGRSAKNSNSILSGTGTVKSQKTVAAFLIRATIACSGLFTRKTWLL